MSFFFFFCSKGQFLQIRGAFNVGIQTSGDSAAPRDTLKRVYGLIKAAECGLKEMFKRRVQQISETEKQIFTLLQVKNRRHTRDVTVVLK